MATYPQLSVVVPVYNEQAGIKAFHESLDRVLADLELSHEIIYCNDGSTDDSLRTLHALVKHDRTARVISLSRNFGKEVAVSAGIEAARGRAILTLDSDGQHPVEKIPEFVALWQAGSRVVVGVYSMNQHRSWSKSMASKLFYRLFNRVTGAKLVPGSTDFRLIDRVVQQDFARMRERNRMTRVLIDWLGYTPAFVSFKAAPRLSGTATYSTARLFKLAIDSVVSMSVSPLYLVAYIGAIVLPLSILLGLVMLVNTIASDPLGLHATGGAYLAVFTLCLVGILMVSQGIIGLYLSHIHAESQNRPLYIIDEANSSLKT